MGAEAGVGGSLVSLLTRGGISGVAIARLTRGTVVGHGAFCHRCRAIRSIISSVGCSVVGSIVDRTGGSSHSNGGLIGRLGFVNVSVVRGGRRVGGVLGGSPRIFNSNHSIRLLGEFVRISVEPILGFGGRAGLGCLIRFIISKFVSICIH